MKKYKTICIGIDQSYSNTGITINADDGKKIIPRGIDLSKVKTKSEKRLLISRELDKMLKISKDNAEEVVVVLERIRLFSKGKSKFLGANYLKSMGGLNSAIVDTAFRYGVKTYSVDTRNWKSTIVGSIKSCDNKYGVPPKKWLTVKWVISLGLEKYILQEVLSGRKNKGTFIRNDKKYRYDNDISDSIGISFSYYRKNTLKKLKIEA